MSNDHRIAQAVYAAKENNDKAEVLILQYIPFIRGEAARFMGRPCTQQDDDDCDDGAYCDDAHKHHKCD